MKPIYILLFSFFPSFLAAQTFIGAFWGKSHSHIEGYAELPFSLGQTKTEEGYKRKSNILGGRIDHSINERFILGFSGSVTNKTLGYLDRGVVGFTEVKFNVLNGSFNLNYRLLKGWYIGGGFGYNYLHQFRLGKERSGIWIDPYAKEYNVNQYNISLATNYRWKGFILEFKWIKGGNTFGDFDKNILVKNMDSFELTFGYLLKVIK